MALLVDPLPVGRDESRPYGVISCRGAMNRARRGWGLVLDLRVLDDRVTRLVPAIVAAERGVRDLGDVDAPLRVYPQAVRRREAAGAARVFLAPLRQDVAVDVADAQRGVVVSRPDLAGQTGLPLLPGHLPDDHGVIRLDVQVARSADVGPGP